MIRFVEKRESQQPNKPKISEFDLSKIQVAITKAFEEVSHKDEERILKLAEEVKKKLDGMKCETIGVEEIQDVVEKVLIRHNHADVAKAYILYRNERNKIRDSKSRLMKSVHEIIFADSKESDLKRDNANVDGNTPMGMMLQTGSATSKEFAKNFMMNPTHSYAHDNGNIHIHDLDFLNMGTTTCSQIDLDKLFSKGFSTGHGFLREPNSIGSYAALAAIAIQANQNDQHGGQSVPLFDFYLAKGVLKTFKKILKENFARYLEIKYGFEKDVQPLWDEVFEKYSLKTLFDLGKSEKQIIAQDLKIILSKYNYNANGYKMINYLISRSLKETDKQTYQAMESFIHNLNTMHSRAGAQVPFSSINFGTDTSPEGRMLTKNLLLAQEAGLGNGETAIFPITIFKVKKGVNYFPNDPNYDLFKLAIRVSAKRLFPNFSYLDAPFNLQYYKPNCPDSEVTYMGCRTRVMGNVNGDEVAPGRGNISFTTINLPRLGLKHGQVFGEPANWDDFYKDLDEKIELVIQQLLERYQIQINRRVRSFPFVMGQGIWSGSERLKPEDKLEEAIKQGSLTCGFIGLAETLVAMTGKHHGENKESQELGLQIIRHMRKRMDEATQKYHLNFALIATPAEGLSGRFTKIDRKIYGSIPGITDRAYYTNSFHIPVYYPISAFKKIELEAPYHALTNGGHISYIELDGDTTNNLEAFEAIIRAMAESGMGYSSINHPVDRDPVCGYTGVIGDTCPGCGRSEGEIRFERIRRITGYLVGTIERFNNAKAEEEKDRVKHGLK